MITHNVTIQLMTVEDEPIDVDAVLSMSEDEDCLFGEQSAPRGGHFDIRLPIDNGEIILRAQRNEFLKIIKFMESNSPM